MHTYTHTLSSKTTWTNAHSTLSFLVEKSKVGVACNESFQFHKPFLTTSRVCCVYKCGSYKVNIIINYTLCVLYLFHLMVIISPVYDL